VAGNSSCRMIEKSAGFDAITVVRSSRTSSGLLPSEFASAVLMASSVAGKAAPGHAYDVRVTYEAELRSLKYLVATIDSGVMFFSLRDNLDLSTAARPLDPQGDPPPS
jgi:hypothetical protein